MPGSRVRFLSAAWGRDLARGLWLRVLGRLVGDALDPLRRGPAFMRNQRRARPIGRCPLHEVSMRRHVLLYCLSALVMSGCSEPRCPFGLMKRGDTCYRCKLGETYVNGSCTSGAG